MAQKDYYEILGVNKKSSQQEIKESYRKLAFQYHPDRNKEDPDGSARMKEINESYAVLSDRKKRGEYDDLRERFGASAYGQFRQSYCVHVISVTEPKRNVRDTDYLAVVFPGRKGALSSMRRTVR